MDATTMDLTARRRAEEELARSAREIEDLYERAPVGYHSLDENGVVTRVNATELEWLGYAREEIVGKKRFVELIAPSSVATFEANFPEFKRKGVVRDLEFELVRKDGSRFWVLLGATAVRDESGRFVQSRSTLYDVTQRKAAEEALRRSEAELKEAQRVAHVGSWEWQPALDVVTWSEELFRIFDRDPALGAPSFAEHASMLSAASFAALDARMQRALADGEPYEIEIEILRAHGGSRWISARGEAKRDASGAIVGLRGTAHDVTERRRLDEELARWRGHLEELVHERTLELERRTEELQQSKRALQHTVRSLAQKTQELEHANVELRGLDRLKSTFIASMSHELRTPLHAILGFAGVLLHGVSGPLNDEQRKQVQIVRESGEHLLALVNDVLDVSRIEAGKASTSPSPFDVVALVREIESSFAVLADSRGIALRVEAPPSLILESDAPRVRQILVNLVGNALKFTDAGSVEVRVEAQADGVTIATRDTGIGIREEDLPKLFEAFGQLPSDGRAREGSGLGLYLSRKVATLLGGRISVESEAGRGSTFTLFLPRDPPIPTVRTGEPPRAATRVP